MILDFFILFLLFRVSVSNKFCESEATKNKDGSFSFDIYQNAVVKQKDQYLCSIFQDFDKNDELFILNYKPKAKASEAHHMILYGCESSKSSSKDPLWKCDMSAICQSGKMTILYAWARDADQLKLPRDIGFRIGSSAKINSLVLQVHYSHPNNPGNLDCTGLTLTVTKQPQKYFAGIYLLGSSSFFLHPKRNSSATIGCINFVPSVLNVFAFRSHTHDLGRTVTAYRVRDNRLKMIGKGNPLWPQAFYSRLGGPIDLQLGDELIARCDYENNEDVVVQAGSTGHDEMCNFYMMFYTSDKDVASNPHACWNDYLNKKFPKSTSIPAPYPGFAGFDTIVGLRKHNFLPPKVPSLHHHEDHDGSDDVIESGLTDQVATQWPKPNVKLGQIGGVSIDQNGFLQIFHRANRRWTFRSFGAGNIFQMQQSPILEDTVVVLNPTNGQMQAKWGAGRFFMPHGITADGDAVWLTDVALHQVFKFPLQGTTKQGFALITLGKRFQPGSSSNHFCKPTAVAINDENGDVYVADGYCNSRIVRFDAHGNFLSTWGSPDHRMMVVHDVKYIPRDQSVCAADRENGRVQCFDENGRFKFLFHDQAIIGQNIYALDYVEDNKGGLLYLVNGPKDVEGESSGFTVNYTTGDLVQKWPNTIKAEDQLKEPHSFGVAGHYAFVGQIKGKPMLKIDLNQSKTFQNKLNVKFIKKTAAYSSTTNQYITTKISIDRDYDLDSIIHENFSNLQALSQFSSKQEDENSFVIVLLVVLPLAVILIGFFYFISRIRLLKDFKILKDHELHMRNNRRIFEKLSSKRNDEEAEKLINDADED